MQLRHAWPALLLPPLTGCAFGAYLSPLTALERSVNGLYEGVGTGITGRVPYRLNLTLQERQGRVIGALLNLESKKAYAVSGTFKRLAAGPGPGGELELNLYENGNKHRGNLYATLAGDHLSGKLRTVLLGKEVFTYTLDLNKVAEAATPAPATPLSPP